MMAVSGWLELLRICCIPTLAFVLPRLPEPGVTGERRRARWKTSLHPRFHSSRIASAFVVDLYVGLPPPVGSGRVGISPVKLTNHFLEANPPSTLTLDRRLTVYAVGRRSPRWRSPCFTISRRLALRLGRIVNLPQALFLGSFAATFSVTLAAYLLK